MDVNLKLLCDLLGLICLAISIDAASKRPNIILIVADDYGFHDVGYHNADMMTPNIDKVSVYRILLKLFNIILNIFLVIVKFVH